MTYFKLISRQWIVDEHDRIIIGEGRKEILEYIDQTGSISQAAKMMKISYKGAWSKLKATQEYLNVKLVHADRHKGTRLTREGKELLEKYRLLKERCVEEDEKIFKSIFVKEKVSNGGKKE